MNTLDDKDWVEIYCALETKTRMVEMNAAWVVHLREIMDKIGPDGENMYQQAEQADKTRIVITVDGGLVQNVYSDASGVEVIVLDGDVEGVDEDQITVIKDNYGGEDSFDLEWIMSGPCALLDVDFVKRVFEAMYGGGQ
jgi:hypothetical protein